jgi:hypothetical protein
MTKQELVIARLTFTSMIRMLLDHADWHSIPVILDYVLRDMQTQQNLFMSGKSDTLKSLHLNGLAADLLVINVEDHAVVKDGTDYRYKQLGEFWKDIGGTWGIRLKSGLDSVHFEFNPYEE